MSGSRQGAKNAKESRVPRLQDRRCLSGRPPCRKQDRSRNQCVEKINNGHKKQLLTYLQLADKRLGYLLNFGEALMQHGITRSVNRLEENR
ncbi:GxxExxY protein [Thioalbus denitrificans]|uniref:GxxExxY protein n=1 Tax=Thioalbus denitrificans TaxID=547122 RepID=UPI001B864C41